MTTEGISKLRTNIFDTLELDTDAITSQIKFVVPARKQGRYRGVVTDKNNASKEFSLIVLPPPAEPSVTVNASENWTGTPTFNVVEFDSSMKTNKGYVVVHVGDDDTTGPRQVRIFNDTDLLFDNQKIGLNDKVILRLFRPGVHSVTDKKGNGICEVTVNYPTSGMPTAPVTVNVNKLNGTTQMQPDKVSISPLQPLIFNTQEGTHLVTDLLAMTNREGSTFVTTLTEKGKRVNLKL
jgi:hypothetical protein